MHQLVVFVALFGCAFGNLIAPAIHAPIVQAPITKVNYYQVPTVVQKPVAIPHIVQTGISYHPFSVKESRFTRTDWATPGNTYAIPAVREVYVTKPGFTTYQEGAPIVHKSYYRTSVPVETVTAQKTYSVVQPVVTKQVVAAPIVTKAYAAGPVLGDYGHGAYGGVYGGHY